MRAARRPRRPLQASARRRLRRQPAAHGARQGEARRPEAHRAARTGQQRREPRSAHVARLGRGRAGGRAGRMMARENRHRRRRHVHRLHPHPRRRAAAAAQGAVDAGRPVDRGGRRAWPSSRRWSTRRGASRSSPRRSTRSSTGRRSRPTRRSPAPARSRRCSRPRACATRWKCAAASARSSTTTRYTNVKPLVPRYLRIGVGGRLDRAGRELEPLSLADVRRALALFRAEGVQAVSICFMNSFANPAHERAAAALRARGDARRLPHRLVRPAAVDPLLRARLDDRAQFVRRTEAQPLSRAAGRAGCAASDFRRRSC